MTRIESLAVFLSLEALLETDNKDKALEIVREIIKEAKTTEQDKKRRD